MKDSDKKIIENLSPKEREQIVSMLARYIIEKRKERERFEALKKLV